MVPQAAHIITFSPTGTTRQVVDAIARGFAVPIDHSIDLTHSDVRDPVVFDEPDEIVVIGIPVYSGRIPEIALSRLGSITGTGVPAVVCVVYGNRAYDDALLELRDVSTTAGFRPVAGAAFVGEHSFSRGLVPIAAGRPDHKDLSLATQFGRQVNSTLEAFSTASEIPAIKVPGTLPYKKRGSLIPSAPETRADRCIACEECSQICPTGAIEVRNMAESDPDRCIWCCACIRVCPENARVMGDPRIRNMAQWLFEHCSIPRQPELFLPTIQNEEWIN